MATAFKIADFFAKIGIKGDTKELNNFIARIKVLDKSLKELRGTTRASFKFTTNNLGLRRSQAQVRKLNSSIKDLKRNANINIRSRVSGGGGGGGGGGVGFGAGALGGAAAGSLSRSVIPGLGVGFALKNLVTTEQNLTGIENALTAATGSAAKGTVQMKFLREETDRLGLNFMDSARGFTNLLASGESIGFGLKNTQELFLGVAESARTLNLSADDTQGVLRAVGQMMSKGTIQSEELKGQLGERLPGAIGIFARSMNVTTEELFKMLEMGEVLAKDTLPNFAKELRKNARAGGALDDSLRSNSANMMRMVNSFTDVKIAFARSGFQEVVTDLFQGTAELLQGIIPLIKSLGLAFRILFLPIKAVFIVFKPMLKAILDLPGIVQVAMIAVLWMTTGLRALTLVALTAARAMFLAHLPFILIGAAIMAVAVVVEDLMTALRGGNSVFAEMAKGDGPMATMAQFLLDMARHFVALTDSAGEFFDLMKQVKISEAVPAFMKGLFSDDEADVNISRNLTSGVFLPQQTAPIPNILQEFNVQIDAPGGNPEDIRDGFSGILRESQQALVQAEG